MKILLYSTLFILFFAFDVSAQEFVRVKKNIYTHLVKNSGIKVTIYKGEVFEKEDDTHIKYGKDKIKIQPTDIDAYVIGDIQSKYLKNQNNYITAIENNPNNWQFDFTSVKKPNDRPIYVYKKNGLNKEAFLKDDFLVIDKNGLGVMFRIAIKNVPSIVYYRADVEKMLSKESIIENTEQTIDLLQKENTELKGKLTNQNAEIQGLKGEITKKNTEIEQKNAKIKNLSYRFENTDFNTWLGNPYSWLAIIFFLTATALCFFLQFSFNKKRKNQVEKVTQSKRYDTTNKINYKTNSTQKENLGNTIGTALEKTILQYLEPLDRKIGKLTKEREELKRMVQEIKKEGERLKGMVEFSTHTTQSANKDFEDLKSSIENNKESIKNINKYIYGLIKDESANVKASNNEGLKEITKTRPILKTKKSVISSAETSMKKKHSTENRGDYQSFVQAAKAILALLDETVEDLKQKSNSSIENKIIKKFEGEKGWFKTNDEQTQRKRKRWQKIIDELEANNRIVDKDLKNELNHSSDKLDKIHELFFNENLRQYINKVLILAEEFRNIHSFTNKKVESVTNQNLKNQINQVIQNAQDYFGITIHYTPLFLKPQLDFEQLEFGNKSRLTDYYKPILETNIRKGVVVEIKYFGMEGEYQKDNSRKKTKIIAK